MRQAFAFFRRNGEGRYSDATLMKLSRHADSFDCGNVAGLPDLVVAEVPFEYDEDTEVKRGGTVGLLVAYDDGKSILAVNSGARRQRIGSTLVKVLTAYIAGGMPFFWVGGINSVGQRFLLSMEFRPTAINGSGAVRYSTHYDDSDDA